MKTTKQNLIIFAVALSLLFTSCEKIIEVPESKNQIESGIVFQDASTATSALLGIYFTLGTPSSAANANVKFISLYADEYNYTAANSTVIQFNQSQLAIDNSSSAAIWNSLYSSIYQCNSLIEGIDGSSSLTAADRMTLKAEAKFLRAYAYFYLVNIYDNIPLILKTDVNLNKVALQTTSKMINDQIVQDLLEAKSELGTAYQGSGKVRANSWAASAMLSRVYLYQGRWSDAEKEATAIINSGLYSPLPKLEDVFLAGSKEAILQFWSANGFVGDATTIIPASATVLPPYTITDGLYQAFEGTDGRKSKWVMTNNVTASGITKSYNYPSKYKNRVANTTRPEFVMALRLSEVYLIRAEALAQQDNIAAAVSDLNVIRTRATGLTGIQNNISKQACLDAVAKERRLELFGEWGNRFLDLKRTGQLDAVLGTLKTTYKPDVAKAFPIPSNEITYNPNLIQNYGY